ncbi:MAG: cupin domain-containing protein [Nitrosomonas sp.]|uniref:cupin domain-containing protein n=1 Tax=Nitrosomonas sp. TaxID=42353 RepID=UPI0025CD517A|nr:cupin domain-containing protein [Nitrosomonas sp.]UJP02267.1 MAG: cupin domain-containing protein [Nitrosomonas sp.]
MPYAIYRTIIISLIFLLCVGFNVAAQTTAASAPTRTTLAEVLAKIPGPDGERYAVGMERGSLRLLVYAPKGKDTQTPHEQDEVYIVVKGKGTFFDGKQRVPFEPNDVLFVPAGAEHRFENFSDDFVAWVVFYGPQGGEKE